MGVESVGTAGRPGRIAARLARHVEVSLAEIDLSLSQYRLLVVLDERSDVASRLADRLAVSRPSITGVVDGLVARGLVERRSCADDRRRVEHVLTRAGRQLLAAADERVDARLTSVASHLDDELRAAGAMAALDTWRQALDGYWSTRTGART